MERVQELPLVLVDALDLRVEDRLRIDHLPGRRLEPIGEARLGLALGRAHRGAKRVVAGERRELLELVRSAIQPSPIAAVIVRASGGLASSRKRRCVTPFVLLLNRSGNIAAKSGTTVRLSSSV